VNEDIKCINHTLSSFCFSIQEVKNRLLFFRYDVLQFDIFTSQGELSYCPNKTGLLAFHFPDNIGYSNNWYSGIIAHYCVSLPKRKNDWNHFFGFIERYWLTATGVSLYSYKNVGLELTILRKYNHVMAWFTKGIPLTIFAKKNYKLKELQLEKVIYRKTCISKEYILIHFDSKTTTYYNNYAKYQPKYQPEIGRLVI
jgi:hypothetical protein